ncbi:phosphate-starvation-inducible PsiE family protein [Desulfonema magnum]|uniref:Phosphate-starvation-inducible E domain-containing protein n=1 Tax=Desulfonema magnum TaxID=45655 RepID=A0A975BT07_9BACT|nr:phosphate-starvation-inducible PsiE family protein [Desulfonema magnum]QTA90917.1 Phosphate-starvation-inducible E domain-containing protein [Desulfonema magnum]
MLEFLKKFERSVIITLIVMMVVVVVLSIFELGWIIIHDIISQPILILDINELLEIFGFFLLVLIGVELLETIKAYMTEGIVHVELVLEVALIAIARKVIILNIAKYDSNKLLSLAALIAAVSAAFFLVKRFRCAVPTPKE